ncbi:dihydrolipoamide acetyltransferase family protein [Streptomyces albireticuli]|uniref:Dihydrolipoamide acetyltransferase component of pyruvate dehydrogenase complex n=1 Tax=Streptomyces albireticuli TaxID=1940 RepID=A0A2A2D053_9ACTN|nr:dihydrolipoamide acetyltransferase family protein [Streptomyces albireticuli]MCD9143833.1 2-oxo acid dehydrogenase subunit E2 [Streptomyces albireticuli]MCD9161736.1 2-oxo acid dehydrogenase subunit E2 [Streptomyces albireticuli]MCD9191950.1 2-oxo acid dehydrogenase subunit E2 [Streptomyces albireticuli]PAU44712.1 branched-chain alpha-keto acid dehydrogenase subunit E2 [Streptomyces albireticuli]
MAVVREFTLPDLGEGLTEAEIVRWLVQVGDVVAVDQPVVEVETAKAMVEVPCPYGGVVTARFGEEGTELPVGAPLLTVAVGEPAAGSGPVGAGEDSGAPASPEGEGSGNVLVGYGTQPPAARRRRVRAVPGGNARRGGADASGQGEVRGVAGAGDTARAGDSGSSGSSGSVGPVRSVGTVEPVGSVRAGAAVGSPEAAGTGTRAVISPLVRRLARERGLDLTQVRGSGPDGLITRADVERATALPLPLPGRAAATAEVAARPASAPPESGAQRVPLRGVRGAVAEKLSRSRREIPDATCWVDADATELLAARRAMNAAGGPKVSLLAVLARITTAALARHPELNATVDMEAREIVRLPEVHLGFAAQTDRGLVVPVVRDAHTLNAVQLSEEIARLTEAARTGSLSPGELTGGTFTLNNYGVFGVDGSTPIINHPEAAMLGVGRIAPKPWVWEGELAVRQVVQLSFTFDHRVCDGGTAGGFLRYVADCVERPAVLLRSM